MLSAAASNTLLKTLEEPPAARRVRARDHRPAQGAADDPVAHAALRVHAADAPSSSSATWSTSSAGRASRPTRRCSTSSCAAPRARPAMRCRCSTRRSPSAAAALDADAVQAALGGAPFDLRLAVLEAVAAEDVAGRAGRRSTSCSTQGHDVRRVADDLLRTLRDAFLAANARRPRPVRRSRRRGRASSPRSRRRWATSSVVRAIEILGQAIVDIRQQTVADPRLVLEVAVVRVARREARTSVETLLERVERSNASSAAAVARPRRSTPDADRTGGTGGAARGRGRRRAGRARPARPARCRAARRGRRREARSAPDAGTARRPAKPRPRSDVRRPSTSSPRVVRSRRRDRGVAGRARRAEGAAAARSMQHAQPIGVEEGVVVFGVPAPTLRRDQRPLPQRSRHDQGRVRRAARVPAAVHAAAARLRRARCAASGRRADAGAIAAARRPTRSTTRATSRRSTSTSSSTPPDGAAARLRRALVSDLGAQVVEERPRECDQPRGATVANPQEHDADAPADPEDAGRHAGRAGGARRRDGSRRRSGGGVVKATVTGERRAASRSRSIPSVVDPDDVETLEDLVRRRGHRGEPPSPRAAAARSWARPPPGSTSSALGAARRSARLSQWRSTKGRSRRSSTSSAGSPASVRSPRSASRSTS